MTARPFPRPTLRASALGLATLCALSFGVLGPVPTARADRLLLADGRTVEGLVRKDGDVYRVISRFGESSVPVADVKSLEAGSPFEAAWRARAEKLAAGDHDGRAALAAWIQGEGRPDEARILAEAVVEADPENAKAHALLGHVRHRGSWMSPDEAVRAQGAKRLEALAVETKSEALKGLVPQVAAYATAADRMVAAAGAPDATGGSATVMAECRIQLAKLKRPIQSFRTGLASNAAGAAVEIQLPEIEVIRVSTTVGIPAGVR